MLITRATQAIELGSAAEWVGAAGSIFGAIGTIAAVAVAIVLARRDGKRLETERREAREDRERFRAREDEEAQERRRFQATQVSLVHQEQGFDISGRDLKTLLVIQNYSAQPITWVVLLTRRASIENGNQTIRVNNWLSIEPGGKREVEVRTPSGDADRFELQFDDVRGQRWQRVDLGNLRELSVDHPDAIRELRFSSKNYDS